MNPKISGDQPGTFSQVRYELSDGKLKVGEKRYNIVYSQGETRKELSADQKIKFLQFLEKANVQTADLGKLSFTSKGITQDHRTYAALPEEAVSLFSEFTSSMHHVLTESGKQLMGTRPQSEIKEVVEQKFEALPEEEGNEGQFQFEEIPDDQEIKGAEAEVVKIEEEKEQEVDVGQVSTKASDKSYEPSIYEKTLDTFSFVFNWVVSRQINLIKQNLGKEIDNSAIKELDKGLKAGTASNLVDFESAYKNPELQPLFNDFFKALHKLMENKETNLSSDAAKEFATKYMELVTSLSGRPCTEVIKQLKDHALQSITARKAVHDLRELSQSKFDENKLEKALVKDPKQLDALTKFIDVTKQTEEKQRAEGKWQTDEGEMQDFAEQYTGFVTSIPENTAVSSAIHEMTKRCLNPLYKDMILLMGEGSKHDIEKILKALPNSIMDSQKGTLLFDFVNFIQSAIAVKEANREALEKNKEAVSLLPVLKQKQKVEAHLAPQKIETNELFSNFMGKVQTISQEEYNINTTLAHLKNLNPNSRSSRVRSQFLEAIRNPNVSEELSRFQSTYDKALNYDNEQFEIWKTTQAGSSKANREGRPQHRKSVEEALESVIAKLPNTRLENQDLIYHLNESKNHYLSTSQHHENVSRIVDDLSGNGIFSPEETTRTKLINHLETPEQYEQFTQFLKLGINSTDKDISMFFLLNERNKLSDPGFFASCVQKANQLHQQLVTEVGVINVVDGQPLPSYQQLTTAIKILHTNIPVLLSLAKTKEDRVALAELLRIVLIGQEEANKLEPLKTEFAFTWKEASKGGYNTRKKLTTYENKDILHSNVESLIGSKYPEFRDALEESWNSFSKDYPRFFNPDTVLELNIRKKEAADSSEITWETLTLNKSNQEMWIESMRNGYFQHLIDHPEEIEKEIAYNEKHTELVLQDMTEDKWKEKFGQFGQFFKETSFTDEQIASLKTKAQPTCNEKELESLFRSKLLKLMVIWNQSFQGAFLDERIARNNEPQENMMSKFLRQDLYSFNVGNRAWLINEKLDPQATATREICKGLESIAIYKQRIEVDNLTNEDTTLSEAYLDTALEVQVSPIIEVEVLEKIRKVFEGPVNTVQE